MPQAERDRKHQEEQRRSRSVFHLVRLARAALWHDRRRAAAAEAAGDSPAAAVAQAALLAEGGVQLPRIVPSRLVSAV